MTREDWYASWYTCGYFKSAKSDFAFRLQQKLSDLGTATASVGFAVPKYIQDAIEFVAVPPADEESEHAADR